MQTPLITTMKTAAGLAVAFFCGLGVQSAVESLEGREPTARSETLDGVRFALPKASVPQPQDPGGQNPPLPDGGAGPAAQTGTASPSNPVIYPDAGGQVAAGGGLIAVTGSYGIGTQVLYVIDTQTRQLAVYESRGGSKSSRRVALVGARRIDLDLQLEGYNDDSEFDYEALRRRFQDR